MFLRNLLRKVIFREIYLHTVYALPYYLKLLKKKNFKHSQKWPLKYKKKILM